MPAVTLSTLTESVAANRIGALAGEGGGDERVHAVSTSTAEQRAARACMDAVIVVDCVISRSASDEGRAVKYSWPDRLRCHRTRCLADARDGKRKNQQTGLQD